jgi:hypothetical protein
LYGAIEGALKKKRRYISSERKRSFLSTFLRHREGVRLLDKQTGNINRLNVFEIIKSTEHTRDSWIQHFRKTEDKILIPYKTGAPEEMNRSVAKLYSRKETHSMMLKKLKLK